jgi:Tfp pilus assembly protein PilV
MVNPVKVPRQPADRRSGSFAKPSTTMPPSAVDRCGPSDARQGECGLGLIDVMCGVTILVIGLLGFSAMVTSTLTLSRSNREVEAANATIMNAAETFRAACAEDFVTTFDTYQAGVTVPAPALLGTSAAVTATLIRTESAISPAMDLNADGDTADANVTSSSARAGVLRLRITWQGVLGPMRLETTTVVARGQL